MLKTSGAKVRHEKPGIESMEAKGGETAGLPGFTETPSKEEAPHARPTNVSAIGLTSEEPQLPVQLARPSEESRQLVNAIWNVDLGTGTLTVEKATAWRKSLMQLVQAGSASVPAIAEFLHTNTDRFFSAHDARLLGYNSARAAMFDVLADIGDPSATGLLADLLNTSASPREIALLAHRLDTIAPEQYRSQALDAARQALAMSVEKKLEGYDVAPLFEVLERYGGTSVIDDLEKSAEYWNYYGSLALASLPEGAGVPSLVRIASVDGSGRTRPGRLQALQMLAQMASSNPEARSALISQIQNNQISSSYWPYLSRPLGGEQAYLRESVLDHNNPVIAQVSTGGSHIKHNNQNFFYAPAGGVLTPEQGAQQLTLIDDLVAVTSTPEGLRVLEQARTKVQDYLSRSGVPLTPSK